ncbi:MAG: glycosyltransferase [Methylococcales bacterium]
MFKPTLPYSNPLIFVIENLVNKYADCDFLIVHPGVIFPRDWAKKLASVAYSDPHIGAVSPICGNSQLFGIRLSGLSNNHIYFINTFLQNCLDSEVYQIPYYAPNCVYMRRDALNAISKKLSFASTCEGSIDKEIAHLLTLEGFYSVITNKLYIDDLNTENIDYLKFLDNQDEARPINRAHPLTGARFLLEKCKDYAKSTLKESLPVQLHVMHSWGGGIEKWVGDFCDTDIARKNLVLKSIGNWGAFGERLALYEHPHSKTPIKYWDLYLPIRATDISHYQYRKVIDEIILDYSVDFIIISSFIGHSLDLLELDKPLTIVIHDYYPFCPAIYINYNGVCYSCNKERLNSCAKENSFNKYFMNVSAEEWQSVRKHYILSVLEREINLVVPAPSVRNHLVTLIPEFSTKEFICIPHGAKELPDIESACGIKENRKLRIVILGHLTEQKGLGLFNKIYKEVTRFAKIFLIGCGEDGRQYRGRSGISIIERYNQAELNDILIDIKPDIGLLLSVWPETFSYTLSELMMSSIPILATNLGSFRDRIVEGESGFLCNPDPLRIIDKLKEINRRRELLLHVRRNLSYYRHITLKTMVAEYHSLNSNIRIPANVFNMRKNSTTNQLKYHIPSASDSIENSLEWMSKNIKGKLHDANRIKPWLKEFGVALIYIWILIPKLLLKIVK